MSTSNVVDLYDRTTFAPPEDAVFLYLLEQAYCGHVPIFGVVMTTKRLKRFCEEHHPEQTPEGAAIVANIMARWNEGQSFQMWVYPKGNDIVVSDDYFILAAIERGQPESIAVQMIGSPYGEGILSVVGPLAVNEVQEMLIGPRVQKL